LKAKIAVVPGTFDPITNGHLDIIRRSSVLFDRIIVCIASNPEKAPLFDLDSRVEMIKESVAAFPGIEVDTFAGLVVRFAEEHNAIALIRGVRAISDFEFEFQMALMNRRLAPEIITLFMMPHARYTYLNSSLIRNVASHGGDVSQYVPEPVLRRLREKYPMFRNPE